MIQLPVSGPTSSKPSVQFGASPRWHDHHNRGEYYYSGPVDRAELEGAERRKAEKREKRRIHTTGVGKTLTALILAVTGFGFGATTFGNGIQEEDRIASVQDITHHLEDGNLQGLLHETSAKDDQLTNVGREIAQDHAHEEGLAHDHDSAAVHNTADIVLTPAAMQQLDESYAEMVYLLREYSGEEVSPNDVRSHADLLESKKPQVLALVKDLHAHGELEDPAMLFNGLTEIFKDDMTADEQQRLREMAKEMFNNSGYEAFSANPVGILLSIFSLFGGVGFSVAAAYQFDKYKRNRRSS